MHYTIFIIFGIFITHKFKKVLISFGIYSIHEFGCVEFYKNL
jgi:hypothetical protein